MYFETEQELDVDFVVTANHAALLLSVTDIEAADSDDGGAISALPKHGLMIDHLNSIRCLLRH